MKRAARVLGAAVLITAGLIASLIATLWLYLQQGGSP